MWRASRSRYHQEEQNSCGLWSDIPTRVFPTPVVAFPVAEAGMPLVKVLNYSIDRDLSWTDSFQEIPARRQLSSMGASVVAGACYFSEGSHCETCLSRSCQEVVANG